MHNYFVTSSWFFLLLLELSVFVPVWGWRSSDSGYRVTLHAWNVQEAQNGRVRVVHRCGGSPWISELENKEGRASIPACYWMLRISYFSLMKDVSRGNSCEQLHRLTAFGAASPSREQTCVCRPKKDSKDFWYMFFFVNHWEHIFYALVFHRFIWGMNAFIRVQWLNRCIL